MATALEIFRDYVVDGVPASGANKPVKADIRSWGTGLEEGIKGVHNADIPSATTLNLEPAAGELVDVTGTIGINAITLSDGHEATVQFTGALTLTHGASLVLPGAANILTVAGDFAIFRGYAAGVVRAVSYFRGNGQALVAPSQASLMGYGSLINATIVESNVANAVTFALKTLAGTDPTANDPVQIAFRNATLATGNYVTRSVTAALSLTISSGSTLGAANAAQFDLCIVLFDDAGTIRMGAINPISLTDNSIYPLAQVPIASSTAEGGAGAADSAKTFYTGAAVTNKAYLPLALARYPSGLAAAGSWNASPTTLQLYGYGIPLPNMATPALLHVRHQVAANTAGGTYTVGSFATCPLQTTVTNEISGASLTANQVTLPGGTYEINARKSVDSIATAVIKWRNTTDSTDSVIGMPFRDNDADGGHPTLFGRFTIPSTKVFELQLRASATETTNGFGRPANLGVDEVYTDIIIRKLN